MHLHFYRFTAVEVVNHGGRQPSRFGLGQQQTAAYQRGGDH